MKENQGSDRSQGLLGNLLEVNGEQLKVEHEEGREAGNRRRGDL